MKRLASKPAELYRGKHVGEVCVPPRDLMKTHLPNGIVIDSQRSLARWIGEHSRNGEILVSREGVTFAAPVLIVHYIEAHRYLLPEPFLKAVEEALDL